MKVLVITVDEHLAGDEALHPVEHQAALPQSVLALQGHELMASKRA